MTRHLVMEPQVILSVACIAATAVGCSYGLTWLARFLAPMMGMMDAPDGRRKLHAGPTPLLGGVAVFCAVLCTILGLAALQGVIGPRPGSFEFQTSTSLVALFFSAGLICLLGLWDDHRPIRVRYKVVLQIIACLPVAIWGRYIDSIELLGMNVHLGPYGFAFTVFWLVACTNIVNLLDGLDGLASTVGLIAFVAIAVLSCLGRNANIAVVSWIAAGCLTGFLLHNWPPAKIFLGDAGSLMIGFLVGAFSLEASLKVAAGFTLVTPLVLLSIPIFDTVMAMLRRKLSGKGIGEPDRGHIHHCLQNRGMSSLQALLSIAGLCLLMAAGAVTATVLRSEIVAVITCASVLAVMLFGRLFGYHETSLVIRHAQAVYSFFQDSWRILNSRLYLARLQHTSSDDFAILWKEVCRRVEEMQGISLQLTCRDQRESDVISGRTWRSGEVTDIGAGNWSFQYTARRGAYCQVNVVAGGRSSDSSKARRVDDLFRMFEALCTAWPISEESTSVIEVPTPRFSEPIDRLPGMQRRLLAVPNRVGRQDSDEVKRVA